MTRENEFGEVARCWPGRTVYLLGGGPSLRGFDFERLRGRCVVAINALGHAAPWAPVLYFRDSGFFNKNRALVDGWAGTVYTISRAVKRDAPDRVIRLRHEDLETRLSNGQGCIKAGRSSGHDAFAVAALTGATTLALLGYDMRCVNGRSHSHDFYRNPDLELYEREFAPSFRGWDALARRAGIQVYNCTPDSALDEFEPAGLDDVMAREARTWTPA